jgi:tRNA(fMet)-specific endonuclease VapC
MKAALIDTDILSMFFKDYETVVENFARYLAEHRFINLSIITYYEILSGLKHRNADKQIAQFQAFVAQNRILPVTVESMDIAAEKYAELRKLGTPVDDIDLLIAGIALANGLVVVTNNTKHFGKISGLAIENWSEHG